MNRVVVTIIGVGVVVGGALAGTHIYGQQLAKSQIERAVEQLNRGGVEANYADLSIGGVVLPTTSTARDVDVYIPELGWRFTLPEVTASVAITALDTVEFELPDVITVQVTDSSGAPTGLVLKVSGAELEAAVGNTDQDVYDFGLSAAKTRIEPEIDGRPLGGFVDFEELEATTRVELDRAAGAIAAVGSFSASSVSFTPPGEGDDLAAADFSAFDVVGSAEANTGKVGLKLTAGSAAFGPSIGAEIGVERFAADISVTPKDEFDLSPLLGLTDTADILQALAATAAISIAEGGVYDQEISFGAVKVTAPEIPDPAFDSLAFDGTDLVYSADIAPNTLSMALNSGALVVDIKGVEGVYYDIADLQVSIASNAAEDGYDYSALATAAETDFGPVLLDIIRQEIIEGGDAVFAFSSGAYSSTVSVNDPFLPFSSIASSTASGETVLKLDADSIDLVSTGEDFSFQLAGAITGQIDLATAKLDMTAPIAAAPEPQEASIVYSVETIVIDDQLWALMDPSGALNQDIPGMHIDLDVELSLFAGLLTEPEAFMGPFPPLEPGAVTINDVTLDMLGFKGAATGAFQTLPVPVGAVDIRLTGWRQLIEGLQATPLGVDPNLGSSLLIASGFIEQFGVEGDSAEETKLEVAFDDQDVVINGQSLAGPAPAPAPEPAPEAAPAPDVTQEPAQNTAPENNRQQQ